MEEGNLNYLLVVLAVLFGLLILFSVLPFRIWMMAKISGVHINLLELTFMKMRSVAVVPIVKSMIMAKKAGIEVQKNELEAHSLAGGDVENAVTSMIIAKKSKKPISFAEACHMDLAMKDLTKKEHERSDP